MLSKIQSNKDTLYVEQLQKRTKEKTTHHLVVCTCSSHGSIDHKDNKRFLCERPVGYECLHVHYVVDATHRELDIKDDSVGKRNEVIGENQKVCSIEQ